MQCCVCIYMDHEDRKSEVLCVCVCVWSTGRQNHAPNTRGPQKKHNANNTHVNNMYCKQHAKAVLYIYSDSNTGLSITEACDVNKY